MQSITGWRSCGMLVDCLCSLRLIDTRDTTHLYGTIPTKNDVLRLTFYETLMSNRFFIHAKGAPAPTVNRLGLLPFF